jgi:hypothetical protein
MHSCFVLFCSLMHEEANIAALYYHHMASGILQLWRSMR